MTDIDNQINGMVYSMTNAAEGNEIIAFAQASDGTLSRRAAYKTGGSGTGTQIVDPLGSQGSISLSRDGRFLFAVNAGSNSISSFRIFDCGSLNLVHVVSSSGSMPNSLTVFEDVLFVTNSGNANNNIPSNVTGFRVNSEGYLFPIAGSTKPLSSASALPTCVVFDNYGKKIIVSEQNTNHISVYRVNNDGTLAGPVVNNSSGAGPFGSVFLANGPLLVAEAGSNALSSYSVNPDGTLGNISASIPNFQAATCWVTLSPYQHFAFTSNAGGHTIATYRVGEDGVLSVSEILYSTPDGSGAPIDSGVSSRTHNLYVLNGNKGSISVFQIMRDGSLEGLQVLENTGLPELGAQGLAVWNGIASE